MGKKTTDLRSGAGMANQIGKGTSKKKRQPEGPSSLWAKPNYKPAAC